MRRIRTISTFLRRHVNPVPFYRVIYKNIGESTLASAAIVAGIAVATAVITGALLVGDSMRGSLRALTIERLGKIESIVSPGRFFPLEDLSLHSDVVPVIYFPGAAAEHRISDDKTNRSGQCQIIGIEPTFWKLSADSAPMDSEETNRPLRDDEVILNQSLASDLNATVGDEVTLRLPDQGVVPADSPLGASEIDTRGLPRLKVIAVLPDRGLARFGLSANQAAPQNAFVSRQSVADLLDRDGQANLLLCRDTPEVTTGTTSGRAVSEASDQTKSQDSTSSSTLTIGLEALGIKLSNIEQTFDDKTVFKYQSLTADALLLPDTAVDAVKDSLGEERVTEVLTYLANGIEHVDPKDERIVNEGAMPSIPYSIVSGLDSTDELPLNYSLPSSESESNDGVVPMVVNDWLADRMKLKIGDQLRIAYYEPEEERGVEVERYFSATVTDIVPITTPKRPFVGKRQPVFDKPPTIYNDPHLTPTVPGLTDADSISDWETPFPQNRDTDAEDDRYFRNFRLTPKAFLPLEDARRLFGSRFGNTTSLKIKPANGSAELDPSVVLQMFDTKLDALGWSAHPIRDVQLSASSGTTPFDGLFLALSFFLIFSAILLITLLMRLALEPRLRQLGALQAIGWPSSRVRRMLVGEGAILATIGAVLGCMLGIGYARLILAGLTSRWIGAVTVPFLQFHFTTTSLLIGLAAGCSIAVATIFVVSGRLLRHHPLFLLRGGNDEQDERTSSAKSKRSWIDWIVNSFPMGVPLLLAIAAIALMVYASFQGGPAAGGGFVGGGMLVLMAALWLVRAHMATPEVVQSSSKVDMSKPSAGVTSSLFSMASSTARRHPTRSTLAIGLMAVASFLIVALSAFSLRPTVGGTGGFELIGTTATPLYRNLADKTVRNSLLGPDASQFENVTVIPFRMRRGDDASCNNLYRAAAPTILGVTGQIAEAESQFDWMAVAKAGSTENSGNSNPWNAVFQPAKGSADDPIPVIIDQNTAMWALGLTGGLGQETSFEYDDQNLHFRVAGLLAGSTLQGKLIIGEANFEQAFPDQSGDSFFLFDIGQADESATETQSTLIQNSAQILEKRLGDVGMDVRSSDVVLSEFLAVQNTYLKTFQSLAALGLLIGTLGLAVAQLRSVLQRRGELGVMRAMGFPAKRLATLVMGETVSLLTIGIGCGVICAIFALIPIYLTGGPAPSWRDPLLNVLAVFFFGVVAGILVVAKVLRMPLLDSLRQES